MSILAMVETRVDHEVGELDSDFDSLHETVRKGLGFTMFALKNIFKSFTAEDIEEGIVDSAHRKESHDYGIDAIYVTANGDLLSSVEELEMFNEDTKFVFYLVQTKKGTGVDSPTILRLRDGIKRVFIDNNLEEEQNGYLYNKAEEIEKLRTGIFEKFPIENIKVKVQICFSGVSQNVLSDPILKPKIEDIKSLLTDAAYTNNEIEILGANELLELERSKPSITSIIQYRKSFKYITAHENDEKLNGYICVLDASEIGKLVQEWQTELFEKNIRDFYKKNDTNEKILRTCGSEEESKYFWSFNNGLTLTCKKIDELPNDKYKIHGLQIVNGCQTSITIYNALVNKKRAKNLRDKPELTEKEKTELIELDKKSLKSETTILVKLIETQDEDLIYKITETTNSQTPVKVFNLKSNENIHKEIEQFFLDYEIYYERRANYYKNKGKKPLIDVKTLSQLYVSVIELKPGQARFNPTKTFTTHYEVVFPDTAVKQVNYTLYLIPVITYLKIKKTTSSIIRNKTESDEYKVALMGSGKFHICCFFLKSIVGKDYNDKSILQNFDKIKDVLNNEEKFMQHFNAGVENFKSIIQFFAGSKDKDTIIPALRKNQLDIKVEEFIRN